MASAGGGRHDPAQPEALTVRSLSKTFVGQRALDAVDFDVGTAEVHALVGHNGSGKSTMIKILAGYHRPDEDPEPSVAVSGTALRLGDPDASRAAGLRFIHQELGLVDKLSVLENLRLGTTWRTRRGRILWGEEKQAARELLEHAGLRAHPDTLVERLSAVQRTQVAVARALAEESAARVMFFDEPTAMLPSSEVDRLFDLIRAMVGLGVSVVYVSHRLEELPRIADRVTVLRDGRVVVSGRQADLTRDQLVEQIIGERRAHTGSERRARRPAQAAADTPADRLRFERVTGGEVVDASFAVRAGEVVGAAGLVGSGVNDISKVLFGTAELYSGRVLIDGKPLDQPDPHELLKRRVAVLPSSRALRSVAGLTVRENLTLSRLEPLWHRGRLQLQRERQEVAELTERFNILPRQPERLLAQLSGGNQQKVSVARWLRTEPIVMVLDEPTQGVDVGGKQEILELLREAARDGVAVLICSSDLEELEAVCDRVLIMRKGTIRKQLTGAELNRETIAEECYVDVPANV
ncbi:MAG TPA: sugar ABC transporter ATP-binding protein [Solirubrobacteraceae bacterium]|nr:sugar ABC transporter ATP-binding protein [Solirubrobacteraceae bacterium]